MEQYPARWQVSRRSAARSRPTAWADLALWQGRRGEAVRILEAAISLDLPATAGGGPPRRPLRWPRRAVCRAQPRAALEALERALAASRTDAVLLAAGREYVALGRDDKAAAMQTELALRGRWPSRRPTRSFSRRSAFCARRTTRRRCAGAERVAGAARLVAGALRPRARVLRKRCLRGSRRRAREVRSARGRGSGAVSSTRYRRSTSSCRCCTGAAARKKRSATTGAAKSYGAYLAARAAGEADPWVDDARRRLEARPGPPSPR